MSWARALVRSDDWVVLDIETTDLDDGREPVEIALVNGQGEVAFATLVRSRSPPAPEAVRLHGLSEESLRAAPTFAEVAPLLRPLLEGQRLVAFNARFDQRSLELALRRHRQPAITASWDCLMERWADYCGFRCSLSVACALAEVPPSGPHHRAAPDALRAWHLIRALAGPRAL